MMIFLKKWVDINKFHIHLYAHKYKSQYKFMHGKFQLMGVGLNKKD